jgi:hypothetical protein
MRLWHVLLAAPLRLASERLGRHRWLVERTLAWYPQKYRRLRMRYERRPDMWEAWHHLGSALICLGYLE